METRDGAGYERRSDRRYDLKLDLRWKLVRRRRVMDNGVGVTIDVSRGGVRFHAGRELPVGSNVDLSVAWPVRLHNVAPMQLVIQGRVVRSADGWVAVRSMQHEFRTLAMSHEHRETSGNVRGSLMMVAAHGATMRKPF